MLSVDNIGSKGVKQECYSQIPSRLYIKSIQRMVTKLQWKKSATEGDKYCACGTELDTAHVLANYLKCFVCISVGCGP